MADKPTNGSSADLSRFEIKKTPTTATRPPSMYLGKSRETLDITMGGTLETENSVTIESSKTAPEDISSSENKEIASKPIEPVTSPSRTGSISDAASQRPSTSAGWLGGWLSRQAPQTRDEGPANTKEPLVAESPLGQAEQQNSKPAEEDAPDSRATAKASAPAISWFGLWSAASSSVAADTAKDEMPVKTGDSNQDVIMEDPPVVDPPDAPKPPAGSSWAFWSTDIKKPTNQEVNTTGQLAVVGESSQDQPEPAKTVPASATGKKDSKKAKSGKRSRPVSSEVEAPQTISEPTGSKVSTPTAKASPPNLLLPSVKSTYRLMENPSILQQITRLILHGQQKPVKHVYLVKDPPKIKKALAIGIHGLFPAPLLRTVIGQPTGTSIRFANHAADAIRRWTEKHGDVGCEIEKVALEGEGKIADRVDNLWKLLLNWIDHVRKADFILVACHSQGVPVALMLVAKLIEFGVVTVGKIGVCAMGEYTIDTVETKE